MYITCMHKDSSWNVEKNAQLLLERDICFEEILVLLDRGCLLDVRQHPQQNRYPGQKIFVVRGIRDTYLVLYVETEEHRFFKTIYPSRKAEKTYPRKPHAHN